METPSSRTLIWADTLPVYEEFTATTDDKVELQASLNKLKEKDVEKSLIDSFSQIDLKDDSKAKPSEVTNGSMGEYEQINVWSEPPAQLFLVRGKDYLKQQGKNVIALKQPSAKAAYECIGVAAFKSSKSLSPATEKVASLRRFLDTASNEIKGDAPKFLVFCFYFTNFFRTEYTYVVHVFKRRITIDSSETGEDPALDRVFSRFLKCSYEEKIQKFKFSARIREMTPTVKASIDMLGGECPVIIARRLTTEFFEGENFFEIDLDCCSSTPASMLKDYSFFVEAQEEDELPERLLGAIRFAHCDYESVPLELDENGEILTDTS